MNMLGICLFVTIVSCIYGIPNRGDTFRLEGLGSTHDKRKPQCYDKQVMTDQYFDDSFICYDNLTYPAAEISYALSHPINAEYAKYIKFASMCVKENNFFLAERKVADEYQLDCVCKSPRKLITGVYHNGQKCHVVANQDIYHANCRGFCNLSYGYIEGYFCVARGWVKRTFLVYCENNAESPIPYTHNVMFQNHVTGGFYYMTKEMPTYCGCRGYSECVRF